MKHEVIKLLKYSQAYVMLLKKMSSFDLIDVFTDSRNFEEPFFFEHFLKASQALNNINNTMEDICKLYKILYDDDTLENDEAELLVDSLKRFKKLYYEYYYTIRDLTVEFTEEANL